MDLWEALQGIGATAGLGSALVLSWRYLTRNRPVAIIVPRQPYDLSREMYQYIEITNPSDRPAILRFEHNTAQNELRIMHSDTIRGAIEAAVGEPAEVVLVKGQTRAFRLARRHDHDKIDDESSLQVRFKWRFAQPFVLRTERRFRLLVRKGDYDALVSESPFDEDD